MRAPYSCGVVISPARSITVPFSYRCKPKDSIKLNSLAARRRSCLIFFHISLAECCLLALRRCRGTAFLLGGSTVSAPSHEEILEESIEYCTSGCTRTILVQYWSSLVSAPFRYISIDLQEDRLKSNGDRFQISLF